MYLISVPQDCTVKPGIKGHVNSQEKVSLYDRCPLITVSLETGLTVFIIHVSYNFYFSQFVTLKYMFHCI